MIQQQDTGLAVRKRVIKLLKSFYEASDDTDHRIDICTKLTMRWFDEDHSVKELAVKTLEELWFHDSPVAGQKRERSKAETSSAVAVIMGVLAGFRERQSPLEDILHKMMLEKQESDTAFLRSRYAEICDTLIDGLVDASDVPGFVSTL
jgi:cohesin loading factor subunit SCC2